MDNFETIYIDTPQDRQLILQNVHQVRALVRSVTHSVPQQAYYTPRYHGWSLAVILAHLNWIDTLALVSLKAALLNIRPRFSMASIDRMNNFTARMFAQRTIENSWRATDKNIKRISDFVLYLPMDKFSKAIFYPPHNDYLTVEKALQQYFIGHWTYHLHEILAVDSIER